MVQSEIAVGARDGGKAVGVAADQQQSWKHAIVAERKAAFRDDRDQGIGQMLGRGDAAGCAVDNDPDRLGRHSEGPAVLGKARGG